MTAILPPPWAIVLTDPGVVDWAEEKEFEEDWDLTATSVLRMVLEEGSEWTAKTRGASDLIVRKLKTRASGVRCVECDEEDSGESVEISIRGLLKHYNPPSISLAYCGRYGATCVKCNKHFEYQKKSRAFVCWACKNGY